MTLHTKQILEWHIESGVNETIGATPANAFDAGAGSLSTQSLHEPGAIYQAEAPSVDAAELRGNPMPKVNIAISNPTPFPAEALALSTKLANEATTLDALRGAVMHFDGCALKKAAKNTVFADGNPKCDVMVIGEAPGEQEDILGIPFCGKSGQLLDNILRTIGLKRAENLYISNTIFWRPPGNRTPTPEEVAICAPFVQKHIALIQPKLLVLAGGVAGSVLGSTESVSKLRGKFHEYTNAYLSSPIPAAVIYHPSYLLRSPGQKAAAWKDMQMIHAFLESRK